HRLSSFLLALVIAAVPPVGAHMGAQTPQDARQASPCVTWTIRKQPRYNQRRKENAMQVHLFQVPYDSGQRGARMGAGPLAFVERGLDARLRARGWSVEIE